MEVTTEERKLALLAALNKGYDVLLEEHQAKMKEFWDVTRVHVDGMSEAEEAAVCFAQYHILGMTPWHTNESSIAAKGLTGEGYKGHVFWDTEIFLFPMLLYGYPKEAKRLLEFRYRGWTEQGRKRRTTGLKGRCSLGKQHVPVKRKLRFMQHSTYIPVRQTKFGPVLKNIM